MLVNLWDLRKKIFEGLKLDAEIVEKQGQDLDVGEKFKVKFTVSHKLFDPETGWFEGAVRFLDCKLLLEGTAYAAPVAAESVSYELGDLLGVGDKVEQVVEFEALASLVSGPWGNPTEPYVKARASARFDFASFLDYWQEEVFWTQIETG